MHDCPAPGCEVRVAFDRLACRRHWYSILKSLRDALWRAWRDDDMERHAEIRAECVAFLEQSAERAA